MLTVYTEPIPSLPQQRSETTY